MPTIHPPLFATSGSRLVIRRGPKLTKMEVPGWPLLHRFCYNRLQRGLRIQPSVRNTQHNLADAPGHSAKNNRKGPAMPIAFTRNLHPTRNTTNGQHSKSKALLKKASIEVTTIDERVGSRRMAASLWEDLKDWMRKPRLKRETWTTSKWKKKQARCWLAFQNMRLCRTSSNKKEKKVQKLKWYIVIDDHTGNSSQQHGTEKEKVKAKKDEYYMSLIITGCN